MSDLPIEPTENEPQGFNRWSKHRFVIMIIVAISIAIGLVVLSLLMYARSGAAQLDLSRPGFSEVRDQIESSDSKINFFSATGSIDDEALEEFRELYEEYSTQATSIDAFGGDPLGDIVQGNNSN